MNSIKAHVPDFAPIHICYHKEKTMKKLWLVLTALVTLIFIFSLTSCAADSFVWGDLNTDTKVDISDAVKLAQFLATWSISFTADEKKAADVYRDGAVDAKDAVLLAQYLADWDVTLGAALPGAMKNVISAAENGIVMNDPSAASTNTSKINSLIKKAAESTEITFRYAHLFPSEQDRIAEDLDRMRVEMNNDQLKMKRRTENEES